MPFPGPALGALTPLCFLFMEANSMWGGNIPSTLAGEFAFSIGLALAVLFLGALRWSVAHGRGRAWCGLLEAVVGMSHGYTLLWAGLGSLGELIAIRGWWRRVGTLVAVHGLAILLMAFWLFPLLGYARVDDVVQPRLDHQLVARGHAADPLAGAIAAVARRS